LLSLKIKDLKKFNLKKKIKANYYLSNIKNRNIILPKVKKETKPVWHQFIILCKKRDKLKKYLYKNGIETKIVYPIPPHKQLAYKEINKISYPVTEKIHKQNLCLPIESHFQNKDLKKVVKLINNFN
jgi:dTDP-4-amino-4,6-dideoxygalactose transaminase